MEGKTKNFEFVVLKKTFTYSICDKCGGSGKHYRSFRKMHFVENCDACEGEGRIKHTSTDEVPLQVALISLGVLPDDYKLLVNV